TTFGRVVAVDRTARTVDVSKGRKQTNNHPSSAFAFTFVPTKTQEESILAIAERVTENGSITGDCGGSDRAGRALLLARPPQLKSEQFGVGPEDDRVEYLKRAVLSLDNSVLAVQG